MKLLLLLPTLLLWPLSASAQGPQPAVPSEAGATAPRSAQRKVHLKLQDATLDDQLIELARADGSNFIADATDFPEATPPISTELNEPFYYLLDSLTEAHSLGRAGNDGRTFLFWKSPDITALARRFVAGETIKTVAPPVEDQAAEDQVLEAELLEYFKRVHGWDGVAPGFAKEIKLADLPFTLRRHIIAYTQADCLQDAYAVDLGKAWFRDSGWKGARLRTVNRVDGKGKRVQTLMVELGGVYLYRGRESAGQAAELTALDASPGKK